MPFNGSGSFSPASGPGYPAVAGTTITAAQFNAVVLDVASGLTNCLTRDGQSPPSAHQPMASFRHTTVGDAAARNQYAAAGQVQDGALCTGTVGGTADAITLTLSPAITAYAAGQKFVFVASGANTGAATLNVNSIGVKDITKRGTTALAAADIPSGMVCCVVYDGTRFQLIAPDDGILTSDVLTWTGMQTFKDNKFEIVDDSDATKKLALQLSAITTGTTRTWSPSDRSGVPTLDVDAQSQVFQRFTTGGSATAYTLTPTPATTANAAGQRFRVAFHTASGTTPTLAVSGQAALNLKYKDSTGAKNAVTASQIPANWVSDVECDGTDWVVMDIPPGTTLTLGSTQATTSGTSIDSATIPSNAKRIQIVLDQLSTDASSAPIIQLADSGGPKTTGYNATASVATSVVATTAFTTGFGISHAASPTWVWTGKLWLDRVDDATDTWVLSGTLTGSGTVTATYICAGRVSLSDTLEYIRLTTLGGTANFDGGSMRVSVEA